MGYTYEMWKERYSNRSDISTAVTHLTKDGVDADGNKVNGIDILIKILNEKVIKGSSGKGFIAGGHTAVCFQEAPPYVVAQNVLHEQNMRKKELTDKKRYTAIGLMFTKPYVFTKGGRPVIYEKLEIAKEILSESEWWRIVSFDLTDTKAFIDWTHEREWRVKGDFEFELDKAVVLLPNPAVYRQFVKKVDRDVLTKINGIVYTGALVF